MRRLTRGEAKRAREKQSAAAPSLAEPRAGPRYAEGIWDEDLLAHASWRLEVYARGDRALTEGAAGKEGEAALTRRRWKRRPTPSRRDGLLSDELLTSA